MQVFFHTLSDVGWVEGELFADFTYAYLNRQTCVESIDAIKLQDKRTGYCETIYRSEIACLFPGERLVVLDEQIKDLKQHIVRRNYKHKYDTMDNPF